VDNYNLFTAKINYLSQKKKTVTDSTVKKKHEEAV